MPKCLFVWWDFCYRVSSDVFFSYLFFHHWCCSFPIFPGDRNLFFLCFWYFSDFVVLLLLFFSLFSYIILPIRLGQQNRPTSSLQSGKISFPTSVLYITLKQSDGEIPVMPGALRNIEYSFIAFGLLWPGVVLSMSQIRLNCVLMLNWIVWKRTIFDIETYLL